MEEGIFFQPEVLRELKNYVEVRLHTDLPQEWSGKLLELKKERLAGNTASPIYEILDPKTGERIDRFDGADLGEKRFLDFLRRNKDKGSF